MNLTVWTVSTRCVSDSNAGAHIALAVAKNTKVDTFERR